MTAIAATAQVLGYKNSRYVDGDNLDIYRFVVYKYICLQMNNNLRMSIEPIQAPFPWHNPLFPKQKVLYFNNLFYINDLYMYMCLLRDKLGTKIGVKNAKKNKYRH